VPKRVVDGEAIATSRKLKALPKDLRLHYPYLLTLAMANGTFRCDPEEVWAQRYVYLMPDFDIDQVRELLDAFEAKKLLYRWVEDGEAWGFWVGIDKPGRLPSEKRRKERHEKEGKKPPMPRIRAWLFGAETGITQQGANRDIGSGFGSGFGMGSGFGPETRSAEETPAPPLAPSGEQQPSGVQKTDAIEEVAVPQVDVTHLVIALQKTAGPDLVFNKRQKHVLTEILRRHSEELVVWAFRQYWEAADEFLQKNAARYFTEQAADRCMGLAQYREEQKKRQAAVGRAREAAQAEVARHQEDLRQKAAEEATLVETELPTLEELRREGRDAPKPGCPAVNTAAE
jgi:hypothetical protein